jgi:ubiquinone/menaquinone biosynthesis C-methylase UbiE
VLDVGCGSGDLAIRLAQGGFDVLGIDFSEAAIAQARKRAEALDPATVRSLEFLVADALRLSELHRQFGAVVDSGFLHGLDPGDCDRFADELAAVLRPGGRYYLLAFSEERRRGFGPRAISEDEVRARFTREKGWHIREVRPAEFLTATMPMPAISACIERSPGARCAAREGFSVTVTCAIEITDFGRGPLSLGHGIAQSRVVRPSGSLWTIFSGGAW